ncbi:FAD-binding protein [Amycolatopsis rubida]|uniref:FAD/FMN-containing dehydrogenase n=1 Tax=Amycolatopsis rubida TaxID=112413 RepID=A0A1I5HRG3_9PSEU|nr:FAD-binding protein [Amycolatopsis rubida]SFO50729.1 FAD/FMN-containing dehydrogenase [Amycolatopsis rubida]
MPEQPFAGLQFEGTLSTDPREIAYAAADFGGIVSRPPSAVARVSSSRDVSAVLRFAAEHGFSVTPRGQGHTGMGQAQSASGIVLDLSGLGTVHDISDDRVVVDAGATWAELLAATLRHGLTPRVLTDYLGLSVGGTLSVGGIGGTSHRYGAQTDNVLSLDVVTGDGVLRTCSPTEAPDLFAAVLAGFGRCGVIVRATIPLIPAPARVRRIKVYYPTAAELRAQQRKLLRERRFDFLQGQIIPGEAGWLHLLDVAAFHTPPAEPDDALLDGLGFDAARDKTEDLSYAEFAARLDETVGYLETTGEWRAPHPWANLFLPDRATGTFLDGIMSGLTRADLGDSGLILTYPVPADVLTTPLFRVPDAPTVFLVAALRYAATGAAAEQMVESNRRWYDTAAELGGTSYPVGAIPFTENDWRNHLGEARQLIAEAKTRYGPRATSREAETQQARKP